MRGLYFLTSFVAIAVAGVGLAAVGVAKEPKAEAQKTPAVGKATAAWEKLPGTDGKEHALGDLKDREVVVVAVTCNHCPVAQEYFDRMKDFAEKHCGKEGKVALVAISISDEETDKLPRMKEIAERRGFNFPYLYDASQESARRLGADITPQFFVLDERRVLVYRGAWDDELNPSKVSVRHVEKAVDALLNNRPIETPETKALGCLISYR